MTLENVAAKYDTDKRGSGLLPYYDNKMQAHRNEAINVLEIGVFFGGSLKMWQDYFPRAKIFGLDHFSGRQGNGTVFANPKSFWDQVHNDDTKTLARINLIECDQGNRKSLSDVVESLTKQGIKFQFIIDDGSHLMKDQQQTLASFFPILAVGGTYFVEDWGSSLDLKGYDVLPDYSNSTYTMMKHFNHTGKFDSRYMTVDEKELMATSTMAPIDIFQTGGAGTAAFSKK